MTRQDIIIQSIKDGKPKKGIYLISDMLTPQEFIEFVIDEIKLSPYRIYQDETAVFEKVMRKYLTDQNKPALEEYYKDLIEAGKAAASSIGRDYVQLRRSCVEYLMFQTKIDLAIALDFIAERMAINEFKKSGQMGKDDHYFYSGDVEPKKDKYLTASLSRLIKRKWPDSGAVELLYG